jgi:hypothetical protein
LAVGHLRKINGQPFTFHHASVLWMCLLIR